MFPTFEFLGKTIGVYGLCAFAGLIVCGAVASRLAKRKGICLEDIILVMLAIAGGMFVGGHIVYGITNADNIVELFKNASQYSFWSFLSTLFGQYMGGMVFYGGFLGGILALGIYCKFSKIIKADVIFDIYAVSVPLFHVFGRIGCFFGGCCYGVESTWGFVVHGNTLQPEINDVMRMPVPLIEAGCNLIIFFILLTLYNKGIFKRKLLFIYMLIYPIVRFILEFYRGDSIRGFIFGLSTSQFISILLFAFSVIYLTAAYIIGRNKKAESSPA